MWVLCPVKEVPLPRKSLTRKQIQENEKARKKHVELCKKIDKVIAEAQKLGAQIDDYEDDYGFGYIYPDLTLPHDGDALDFDKFGPLERAYYEYEKAAGEWSEPQREIRTLIEMGLGFQYVARGMFSVGHEMPKPPPLPDWAR